MSKQLFYSALVRYAALDKWWGSFNKEARLVILAYHRICPHSQMKSVLKEIAVEPEMFDQQISFSNKKFNILPLESAINCFFNETNKNSNCLAITFDDAYEDSYTYAFPILKKYNVPATILVPTSYIETGEKFWWEELAEKANSRAFLNHSNSLKFQPRDKQRATLRELESGQVSIPKTLSWSQMQEMEHAGISFGAHSSTHSVFSRLSENEIQNEIIESKNILISKLKNPVNIFAFPYGEKDDFNEFSKEAVKKAGFLAALTMVQGINTKEDDLYSLKRIGVGGLDTMETFRLKIAGFIPWLSQLKSYVV